MNKNTVEHYCEIICTSDYTIVLSDYENKSL